MNTDRVDVLCQKHNFDLDMDLLNPRVVHEMGSKIAHIIGSEKAGDHIVYKIQVNIGECSWIVQKRYRDFYALHEELAVSYRLPWDLLPPKKLIGNLSASHIEKRKVALDKYLKTVLSVLLKLPIELIQFLEIDRFDVNSVCHKLARDLFQIGDIIIANNEVFEISPLQLHCINRRLLLPLPTCDTGDPTEDIGHLFSFVNQTKHIKIQDGEDNFTGADELTYDVSIFKSLETLTLCNCDIELLNGLECLQEQLWELKVIRCIKYLKDILVTSVCWNRGLLTAVEDMEYHQLTIDSGLWRNIVLAAFTHNQLTSIDSTITLLPNIRKLDLSHNLLTDVQFLEGLLHLRDIDLSYNDITDVEDFPYKLGAISSLNLAGNRLRDVKGLDKMYSLKRLRISDNLIEKMSNVLPLGNLPLLENIDLHGNPCTRENFYNVRLIAQFGDRYQEVTIDGIPTCRSDLEKAEEVIKLQNSYDFITGPESYYLPATLANSRETDIATPLTPPRSPKFRSSRKHQHIVEIKPALSNQKKTDNLTSIESEEATFRDQVEKLRRNAGESWLTFYNELQSDYNESDGEKSESTKNSKESCSKDNLVKDESSKGEGKTSKPVNKVRPMQRNVESTEKRDDGKSEIKKVIYNIVKEENNEKKIPGVVLNVLEDMLDQHIDLFNETFLVFRKDEITATINEHIITYDSEENSLVEIDLLTGSTVDHYDIDKVRNVRVIKEHGELCLYFDQEEGEEETSEKGVWTEKHLKFREAKDCAGVFALMVGSTCEQDVENQSTYLESLEEKDAPIHVTSPIDNPFLLKNELLLGFFQEFVQKTVSVRIGTEVKGQEVKCRESFSSLAYQNIGIGAPFLRHALPADGQQDVVLILWAGCIPYLFPEEELPVCLVMTNINIFLFRVFLPEDISPNALPKTVKEMKDIFHCFYSFSLKFIKEIVVGLYDQAFRIEVDSEGPRGTFTFLTRHATKTSQFLEAYCSVVGLREEKSSLEMRRRTSFLSGEMTSSITYPDESKIEALKSRLTAQDIYPIDDRENVISYYIVYMFSDSPDRDEFLCSTDIPVSTIKSLILTNLRLFLCDEDYVHFPPPSFAVSSPTTPEWVVDDEKDVADLIGVDLWESTCPSYMLAGNHGMSLTFDNPVMEFKESLKDEDSSTISWKIIFGSLSEREQFVRSLSCLWKNQFSQDLTVTYSKLIAKPLLTDDSISESNSLSPSKKGHSRVPSGNLTLPSNKPIEHPEMLMALNPVRQKSYFVDNIAQSEDEARKGMVFITCSGCIPYSHPEKEIKVVVILSDARIYVVSSEVDSNLINASKSIIDGSGGANLCMASIDVDDLQQVVVGMFDQFIRIEGASPDTTFTLIIRDHEKTNRFMELLSQILLARKPDDSIRSSRAETTPHHIYKLYRKEDEESGAMAARSEFIHPNSEVKIVYPSDESLDKLKENVYNFVSNSCEWHTERDFGILLYLLVFAETEDDVLPCTFIVSEKFTCLMKEDYVNYPLPMFAKELPRVPQYKLADARLIASIVRIELQDLANGTFSIVFNRAGVEPSCYDQRFKTASVEENFSLVTDLNTDQRVHEEQGALTWNLRTQSFNEREKIFNILSKMWTSCYAGRTLPVVKRRNTRIGDMP